MIRDLATVLTNMLSAMPWLGGVFVQFYPIQLIIATLFLFIVALRTTGHVNVRAQRGYDARTTEEKSA